VLISGTYSYLKTAANGGNVQNANGYDVIFTSDTGCGTKLDHEVESYNATTGAVSYWVRVPTVSHSNDTTLYLCYGNAAISTSQENRTGVWDTNFRGVWHLGNGSTLSANDSTSNSNNGTINGATATAGQIGGSASFSGSSPNITTPASIDLDDAFTLSAWINLDDVTHNTYVIFGFGYNNSDNYGFLIPRADHSGLTLQSTNQGWPPGASFTTPSQNVSAATWTHVVLKKSAGSSVKIYQNGAEISNEAMRDTGYLASTLTIGSAVGANYFKGKIDEAHFSTVERTTDWVKTEYNNQSSPATFYTISSSDGSYTYHRIVTIDHTKVPNTDQSNFPVLISGTYPFLATTANGGNVQNSNGYDVIFTSDCGCTTKLDHEVESYNAATGAVNYWVRVPTVSHTRDPIIYMCYGNAAVSTSQENKTGVWDANFRGVWHLGNGGTLSANDSTSNANNGTINGAAATAGQIGGSASFSGSSQNITTPASVDLDDAFTLSAWINLDDATHNTYVIFGLGYNNSDNYGFLVPRADHSGLTLQSTNQGWPPGASFTTPSQNV